MLNNDSDDLAIEKSRLMGRKYNIVDKKSSKSQKKNDFFTDQQLPLLIWPRYDFEKFKKLFEENIGEKNLKFGYCQESLLHR